MSDTLQGDSEMTLACVLLANCLHPAHEYEEAISLYEKWLPAMRTMRMPNLISVAIVGYAHSLRKLRRLEGAASAYEEAAGVFKELGNSVKADECMKQAMAAQVWEARCRCCSGEQQNLPPRIAGVNLSRPLMHACA